MSPPLQVHGPAQATTWPASDTCTDCRCPVFQPQFSGARFPFLPSQSPLANWPPAPVGPVSLKSVLLFVPVTTMLVDSPAGTHVSASSGSPRLTKPPAPRPPAPGPSPRSSEDGLCPLSDQRAPLFGTKAGWPDLEKKKNTCCPVELEFQINTSCFSIRMPPAVFAFSASVVFPGIAQQL